MSFGYCSLYFIGSIGTVEGRTHEFRLHFCQILFVKRKSIAINNTILSISFVKLGEDKPAPYKDSVTEAEKQLHAQLVTSSWCGLLAALTPLIDAATDESITENVLKAMQNYASLCGTLGKFFVLHQTLITTQETHTDLSNKYFRYTNTARRIHNSNLSIVITTALCAVGAEYGLSILWNHKYVYKHAQTETYFI